ncbi:MAG TPA: hypothetical protein PLS83_00350 [Methanothrix soehngenii]|nr:hypothetical protein [Methanothrix soehngenii]
MSNDTEIAFGVDDRVAAAACYLHAKLGIGGQPQFSPDLWKDQSRSA